MLISRFLPSGPKLREEWLYLAGSVLLVLGYLGLLGWFQYADVRFDKVFLARLAVVRTAHALQHPLSLNVVVPAADPAIALLDGWSTGEAWGVWNDGRQAALDIALPRQRPAKMVLELTMRFMMGRHRAQDITIYSGAEKLGSWHMTVGEATLRIAVPPALIDSSGVLRLTIAAAHPRRPSGGVDDRLLGFGLEYVALRG
jgi:hypothetical protein